MLAPEWPECFGAVSPFKHQAMLCDWIREFPLGPIARAVTTASWSTDEPYPYKAALASVIWSTAAPNAKR